MNKAALLELADFMVSCRSKFDMNDPVVKPYCGSAGCIAGHAALLWPEVRFEVKSSTKSYTWDAHKLNAKLGISEDQAEQLFYGRHEDYDTPALCEDGSPVNIDLLYETLRKSEAIDVVRRFANTGKVRWPNRFAADPEDAE